VRRLLLALLFLSISLSAFAHEVRPAFLRITETAAGEFNVVWKQPVISGRRLSITPTFPEECSQSEPRLDRISDTVTERFTVTCGLRQGELSLPGLENTLTDAFVEISYLDDPARSALLKPANPILQLSGPAASPAGEYLRIGVDHIIFGWDHLLFVIGLTLLVGGRKVWGVDCASRCRSLAKTNRQTDPQRAAALSHRFCRGPYPWLWLCRRPRRHWPAARHRAARAPAL